MRVRPADPEDAEAVHRLEEQLFGVDAWSASSVLEELTGARRRAVVAVEDDQVLGYAVTLRSEDVVDLQRIAVHPDRQGRGTARALLDDVVSRARADGANRMLLEVSARNTPALRFYARAGFVEIDRRRRYYRDGSDALVLRLPLGAGRCGGRQ